MPQSINEVMIENEREARFLKQLQKSYSDAYFDAHQQVWRSASLRPEDCDFVFEKEGALHLAKQVEDGFLFVGSVVNSSVSVSVFLVRLHAHPKILRAVLGLLRDPLADGRHQQDRSRPGRHH